MAKKAAVRKKAAPKKPARAFRKTIKAAPPRIPSVTLDGERMYPDEAKKYWADIKRSAS
tara:strand:+ start:50 stop:226 length:177 start_codon:yes stop_codon:yes gene_type:complete